MLLWNEVSRKHEVSCPGIALAPAWPAVMISPTYFVLYHLSAVLQILFTGGPQSFQLTEQPTSIRDARAFPTLRVAALFALRRSCKAIHRNRNFLSAYDRELHSVAT